MSAAGDRVSLFFGIEAEFTLPNQHGRSGVWSALTTHVKSSAASKAKDRPEVKLAVRRRGCVRDEDVKEFANQLRSAGIDAYEWGESIPGEKGVLCGIIVAGLGFFPVWELNKPDNQGLLGARDFAAIKAKRGADWEPIEPHLRRRV
jgi:hypothetical protein